MKPLLVGRGSVDLLVGQNRQVLGDGMAEDGTEDAGVEAASIAGANDGLFVELVGQRQCAEQTASPC